MFLFCSVVLPNIQLLGPNKALREGDSANLTCKIIKGLPEPQVSWFKNGTELEVKNRTLFLTNVTDEDEARYACRADNIGGFVFNSLYVAVKSKFTYNESTKSSKM